MNASNIQESKKIKIEKTTNKNVTINIFIENTLVILVTKINNLIY